MGGRVGGWAKLMRPRDVLTSSIQAIWRLPGSTNLPPPPPLLPSPPPRAFSLSRTWCWSTCPTAPLSTRPDCCPPCPGIWTLLRPTCRREEGGGMQVGEGGADTM